MSDSTKPTILIQLDSDAQPSVFDRVVAVDAGADHIFSYGRVTLDQVEGLVHGAMFTRGPDDLKRTAIFIGGSDVRLGEQMLEKVSDTFFRPLTVSVMMDANGSNTTAAAAVIAAGRHLDLANCHALVLGGTGPVGQRCARLLAGEGATVKLASRSKDKADQAATVVNEATGASAVSGVACDSLESVREAIAGATLVIGAGAAGVELLPAEAWEAGADLKVAIDLNAVPPAGLAGIEVTDKARDRKGVTCYGAIGVGGTKMKIHKAALRALFEANDRVLDAEAIYELGKTLG